MKKTTRIFGILLIAAMLLGALAMTASAAPATRKYDVNGDGGTENAYEIRTAEDLLWFAQQVNGGNKDIHGVLMNDIDMSTVCSATIGNWTPIGNNNNNFRGYFDGRGFTVKNLYFNDETANYVGLFGYISNPSLVRNVTVTGTLTGNDCVAGIVGRTMGSTSGDPSIINCVNYATVSAGRYAAGILGFGSANVYSSANHGDMSTRVGYAGGIVAFGYDNIVQDCLNTGNISGGNAFGLGHMNQGSCKLSNFLNLGSASSDGVSDKGATNCYSVSKTSVSGATRIDADDVRVTSGELAFLLGGTWGQEIGKDANPVPGGMKVYRNVEPSSICSNIVYTYSNTQGNQTINHDVNLGAEAFDNGICKNCGYECTHLNATCTYSNLTDSTHDTTYNCCNKLLTAQPHTFDVAGLCPCGTQAVATVTTAGNVTTYYVDVYAAAAYAAAQDHSTMILLADVDLDTGKGLFEDIRNKVNVTLDLNGKTLSSENSHTINWNIYGHQEAHVTLTINDSVGTGKVINRKFNAVTTSTHLVINGGYFEAGIGKNTQAFAISSSSNGLSYKDTVIINGGTFHSNNGISSGSLSYVVINGGTFTGVTSVIHSAYEGQFVINGGNFPEGITTRV
jgi:hypothetical protein